MSNIDERHKELRVLEDIEQHLAACIERDQGALKGLQRRTAKLRAVEERKRALDLGVIESAARNLRRKALELGRQDVVAVTDSVFVLADHIRALEKDALDVAEFSRSPRSDASSSVDNALSRLSPSAPGED